MNTPAAPTPLPSSRRHITEWARGFTRRARTPRRIRAAMATPLPHEPLPAIAELEQLVDQHVDAALPGLDDGHGHILDEWLATREADAAAALEELIARQQHTSASLINKARTRWERAEHRYQRRANRVTTLTARAAALRNDHTTNELPDPDHDTLHTPALTDE